MLNSARGNRETRAVSFALSLEKRVGVHRQRRRRRAFWAGGRTAGASVQVM